MADIVVSTTTNAVDIPEIWSKKVLVQREAYLVLAKCVERFDADVASYGDKIHMPWVTDLHAHEVSEGTDVTYQATTEDEEYIEINQMWEASFLIHDKYSAQTKYATAEKKAQKASFAIAKKMDATIAALYADADEYVGDGSTDISKDNILDAILKLDLAEAPGEDRHFVVDSYGKRDLFDIDDFTRYDATGQLSPAVTGKKQGYEFGDIYGVTVHVSNNIATEVATPPVVHGMMFHKEAIGLAVQKNIKVEKSRLPEKLSDLYTTVALWGVKTLRSDHIVDFRYKQG